LPRDAGSRAGGERRAGGRAVLIHPSLEILDRVERLLGAQTLDEGATQAPPV
jgi:hypothetical protein